MKARERKVIVVTVSQEHGFQDSVFAEVDSAFVKARPVYLSRLYCGFTGYFPPRRSALRRVERLLEQLEELETQVAASRELRVGISFGPVMVEPGWFGAIKNIIVPGPTVNEAVECEKSAGLSRSKLEALWKVIQR